jgi:hypothetical protein
MGNPDAGLALLASLVLEDGRRWGEAAHPHQWRDARAVLSVDGPRRHWLGRARGWSKTTDVAGLSLAVMLTQLSPGAAAYAAAADRDQARLLTDKIRGFTTRTPELVGSVTTQAYRVVAERSGVVLDVLAADAASSYGLTPSLLVIDELAQWSSTANAREFYMALSTSLPKVPDSRMVIMTTAGDPAHFSKRIFDAAVKSPLWRVSSTAGPAPWQDPVEIAEQEATLPPPLFRRLFWNEWSASEDRLVDPADLVAALVLDCPVSPEGGRSYVAGLDIGLKNDATVLAVGHAGPVDVEDDRSARRVDIDLLLRWQGSREKPLQLEDIERAALEVNSRYRPRWYVDPWQAAGLIQRLSRRGLRVEEFVFSSQSVGRLAHGLYSALKARRLRLPAGDEALRSELLNVRLRETSPGVYRLDHDSGRHDDMAVAIAIVVHHLLSGSGRDFGSALSWLRERNAALGAPTGMLRAVNGGMS